jgi:GR25 family glycosyltransferase involved in LPS biosynthesis
MNQVINSKIESSGIGIYFINLEDRLDRLNSFVAQFESSSLSVMRVGAVTTSDLEPDESISPPGVVAIWKSHQKVFDLLIQSEDSHAIIFEDDAVIESDLLDWLRNCNSSNFKGIDVFQFGYLKPRNTLNRINYDPAPFRVYDLERYIGVKLSRKDFIFRNWIRVTRFMTYIGLSGASRIAPFFGDRVANRTFQFKEYLSNEKRLRSQLRMRCPIVYHSFEAGAHAYVISRDMAAILVRVNKPVFLSADLCLMGIARSHNFRFVRTSKSFCQQSNSASSIIQRTKI